MEISRSILGQILVKVHQEFNTRKLLWQSLSSCKSAAILDAHLNYAVSSGILSKSDDGKYKATGKSLDEALVMYSQMRKEDPENTEVAVERKRYTISDNLKPFERPYQQTLMAILLELSEKKKTFNAYDIAEKARLDGYNPEGLMDRIKSTLRLLGIKRNGKRYVVSLGEGLYRMAQGSERPDEKVKKSGPIPMVSTKKQRFLAWARGLGRSFTISEAVGSKDKFGYGPGSVDSLITVLVAQTARDKATGLKRIKVVGKGNHYVMEDWLEEARAKLLQEGETLDAKHSTKRTLAKAQLASPVLKATYDIEIAKFAEGFNAEYFLQDLAKANKLLLEATDLLHKLEGQIRLA